MTLILASKSSARRAMLSAAGVPFEVSVTSVDEESAKMALREQGFGARDVADALAELKALRTSQQNGSTLVLGCDSTIALDDGQMLDKPQTRDALAIQLRRMSGTTHTLYSAAVICENGRAVWRSVARAKMTMRTLSEPFIEHYVDNAGDAVLGCLGGYMIEGWGAQLFADVDGSNFTVQGLPLLPLLDYLRVRGILTS